MLSLYFFYDPTKVESPFPKCPFHQLTGMHCPGCGSQRAINKILNGSIVEGIRHNYLILLASFVIIYQLIYYLLTNFTSKTMKNLFHNTLVTKIILILVLLFWFLRNVPLYPFTELAP
ncbi:DUF2752 domain-containing protein [Winogradskyella sp.]|uniref:DUF2752 domain-containing protein n=1 Tax=Winogradskyella sp. TaxID=1883156 RepID=UPI002618F22A|nr:DUF2752 domain-containing protein [Winogradskyella sp.]